MARKQRTAAQRAATRRMIAANRARRRAGSRPKRRRAAPQEVTVARKSSRRRSGRRNVVVRRRGGSRPMLGGFVPAETPMAVVGAIGGLVLPDLLLRKLPLPAQLQSGGGLVAAKIGLSIVAGRLVGRFAGRAVGRAVLFGGIAGALAPFVRQRVGLGALGDPDGVNLLNGAVTPGAVRTPSGQEVLVG